jgi:hypothetical protein
VSIFLTESRGALDIEPGLVGFVGQGSNDIPDVATAAGATDTTSLDQQQEADQQLELLDGGAELAQGYAQRHSRKYLHLHQKFIFITSIFIGFIAIVIQYVLESESGKPHSNTGFMRPGWARHRSDGWQHQHGR